MNKNLKQRVYDKIKLKILNNEFKPGEYLEEKMLTETLGVSRTPVREAINVLETEKLVQILPKKGIFVTSLSTHSIKELFQARYILEPKSLELAFDNLDKDILMEYKNKFTKKIEEEDFDSLHKLDYEFHNYIHSMCQNRFMIQYLQSISDNFQRVRTQDFYMKERTIGGANEHIHLIDYILARNLKNALSYLEKHISSTEKYYFKSMI